MQLPQWSKVHYNNTLHFYGTFHPKALHKLCTENITTLQQLLSREGHKATSIQDAAWEQYGEGNLSDTFPITKLFLHFQKLHTHKITLLSIFCMVYMKAKRTIQMLRGNNTINGPILLSFEPGAYSRSKPHVQSNKVFPPTEMQAGKGVCSCYNTFLRNMD